MRRSVAGLTALLFAAALIALGSTCPAASSGQRTVVQVIDAAFERGEISYERMILLKAYSVYDPSKLPDEYGGTMPDKCGLSVIEEIDDARQHLTSDVAYEIESLRARPSNMTYIDTEHFRIHYDTSGSKTIYGWPNTSYRDAVCDAAEASWDAEVTDLGFRAPPNDQYDPDGGGGSSHYDIYVQEVGTAYYGYTQYTYNVPGTPQRDATSYVVIDNDYSGFGYPDPVDPMSVTVAHEFNHSCQGSHDYLEASWFKECTATWAEDVVFDDINDYYSYLGAYLGAPYRSLDDQSGSGLQNYGACVWDHFLTQHTYATVVPDIWWECEGYMTTFTAIDNVLTGAGSSLEDEFRVFAVWNWFTGSRDDGNHYEEGSSWPLVNAQRTYASYPVIGGGPNSTVRPDHMGNNYIQLLNTGTPGDALLVSYDGPNPASVLNYAYINTKASSGSTQEYGEIVLDGSGSGSLIVGGWGDLSQVWLVAVNASVSSNDMVYTVDAEITDTGVGEDEFAFGLKPASPNPFVGSTSINYSVPSGGGLVEVNIYDVTGRHIRTLMRETLPAGDGVSLWDGLDARGQRVSSGVYFARLDINGLTASGKLVVLK